MKTPQTTALPDCISLLGFGEAGAAFAKGWRSEIPNLALKAFDTKTERVGTAAGKWQDYCEADIEGGKLPEDALAGSPVVFSLVTAEKAYEAACTAAKHLPKNAMFFDGNSCAPDTKRASAAVLEAAGVRYVDVAIMSPVHPKLHKVPLLISGPQARQAEEMLKALGMQAKPISGGIGRASSVKMMRSVMIKGLEALTLECFLAARKAGVEDEVLASIDASFPGWDWAKRGSYNLERSTSHGLRRAEEMQEVAKTVASLGINNSMSQATADWQHTVGSLCLPAGEAGLNERADAILSALSANDGEETHDPKRV